MSSSSVQDILSSPTTVITTGCTTLALASLLSYVLYKNNSKKKQEQIRQQQKEVEEKRLQNEFIDPIKYPGGKLTVYYGSQTGTSESFAQEIEREGPSKGFYVNVVDLEDVMESSDYECDDEDDDDDNDQGSASNNNVIVKKLFKDVSKMKGDNSVHQQKTRAIFLVATYGEGEPTDNATMFVQQLKALTNITDDNQFEFMKEYLIEGEDNAGEEKKSEDSTGITKSSNSSSNSHIDFCVFGLGNKQYEHYNAMGKLFDYTLDQIGCNRILSIGLGDDDSDLENDFEAWKDEKLWPTLIKKYMPINRQESAINNNMLKVQTELPDCPYTITYTNNTNTNNNNFVEDVNPALTTTSIDKIHSSSRHYFTSYDCPIVNIRELRNNTTNDDKIGSTLHIEIDISKHKGLSYNTADNVGILPKNDPNVVNDVATLLGYDLNQIFTLNYKESHQNHGILFPSNISIREALARYCDLTICPRRSDLKLLSNYATDSIDKNALLRMSSKEGKVEYKEKITDKMLGFVDILQLCPSISIPLEHFFFIVPRLHPRFYTISSSSSLHPKTIHITVAITKIQLSSSDNNSSNNHTKPVFNGVCSTYLSSAKVGSPLRIFVRESSFKLPTDISTPILMVGPGTGIAPMRALIQERIDYLSAKQKKTNEVGKNILYFGCKYHNEDYIYENELQSYVTKYGSNSNNNLFQLNVAFSRDNPKKKVYVQDLLKENKKNVWDLIDNQKAYIYVCGGVKMGSDVTETLKDICYECGNLKENDSAKTYVTQLSNEHRYVQELWA